VPLPLNFGKMKFLLTKELGRLAKWLRILGYDTAYFNQDKLSSLIIQALKEDRIIVTRNQKLAGHAGTRVVLLEKEKIREEVSEVLEKLKIKPKAPDMFSRCIICNEKLLSIDKEKIKDKVPEYVYKTQERFITCPICGRIYWQGTHFGNVNKILEEITQ
jgi:uncharacterized protein with PIN domain